MVQRFKKMKKPHTTMKINVYVQRFKQNVVLSSGEIMQQNPITCLSIRGRRHTTKF